jgi:hypothetical protein
LIVQVPVPTNETVAPEIVQTPALEASIVKVTARPELALADTVYPAPPTAGAGGGVDLNVIVCGLAGGGGTVTVNDCCTCGAAWYVPLPAWFALIVQVPAPTNDTVEPLIVQTPALAAAIVKVTARPELAVAETV